MSTFNIAGITGKLMLYTTKGANANGEYPLKVRVTYQRKAVFFSLKESMTAEQFGRLFVPVVENGKVRIIKFSGEENSLKNLVLTSFEHIKREIEVIYTTGEYSHDKLRTRLQRGRGTLVSEAFDSKIKELTDNGQVGTAESYTTARNFFIRYKKNLEFTDITPNWLRQFETWAIETNGISVATLGVYLRNLRTVFNIAIRNGDIPATAYPFGNKFNAGYTIPTGAGTKIALTIAQVNAIAQLELKGSLDRCRNVFLLSLFMAGMNFKDLLLLKWGDIKKTLTPGGNVIREFHFVREKTKRTSRNEKHIGVPIINNTDLLLNRIGNKDKDANAYVIPFLSDGLTAQQILSKVKSYNRQVNKQLKVIQNMVEIDGLSNMVARHSFATIMKNNNVPETFIGEMLGHSSQTVTATYFKDYDIETKWEWFKILDRIELS